MQPTMGRIPVIRDADDTDLQPVVAVLRAAHEQFAPVLPPAFYRTYLNNLLDVPSRIGESQLLVAECDGCIVGTITFYPDASQEGWGWPAQWTGIRAAAVLPEARGHGIGRRLTQACIDRSRGRGAPAVGLHTGAFMTAAMALYERLGFRRLPEFDREAAAMFASDPNEPPIAVLAYRLDLALGSVRGPGAS